MENCGSAQGNTSLVLRLFGLIVPAVLFVGLGLPADAQVPARRDGLQPAVLLVYAEADRAAVDRAGALPDEVAAARDLLESTVEGHLRSSLRYELTRWRTDDEPELFIASREGARDYDGVVFARTAPRRDGSLRVELDLWRDDRFIWSQESQLPLGQERFRVAVELADRLEDELARSFDGFGRIEFRNTGVPGPYYVYVGDELLGVSLRAVELPRGAYDLEVRRRDEGFEHVVGRRRLELQRDDYVSIRFALERDPPSVPGFLRLTNPAERWHALLDVRGAVLIPMEGFSEYDGVGRAGFATGLFNDVFFRGHVLGFEAAYLNFRSELVEDDLDLEVEFAISSLMLTTGLSVGPVSRVDYVVRVGAGPAMTSVEPMDEDASIGYSPAFTGSMEFGFGFGRTGRLSLNIGYYGVIEDDELFSFIALGLGLGGRF